MGSLAEQYMTLRVDDSKVPSDLKNTEKHASKAGDEAGKTYSSSMLNSMKGLAAGIGGLFAVSKGAALLGDSIAEAREAAKVGRETEAVIKSTGGAANVTKQYIDNYAEALSNKIGVDDDAIVKGQNMLLTFTNIRTEVGAGNDIFGQASNLMADMAAKMGSDMSSEAVRLGKALNDPLKGITALTKVGVTFSEEQKKQIKSMVEAGNTMGAQKVIIAELNKEFGGVAEAMADPADKAAVAWGNTKEAIGDALMPAVEKFSNFVSDTLAPGVKDFVAGLTGKDGPASKFRDMGEAVKDAVEQVKEIINWMKDHKTEMITAAAAVGTLVAVTEAHNAAMAVQTSGGLAKYVAQIGIVQSATKVWTAVQWALNLAFGPIGLIVLVIGALVAGIIYAYKHNEKFREIVKEVWSKIKDFIKNAWENVIKPVFTAVGEWIKDKLIPAMKDFWENGVKPAWEKVQAGLKFAWENVIKPIWEALKFYVTEILIPLMKNLWENGIKPAWDKISAGIKFVWENVIKPAWEALKFYVSEILIPLMKNLWENAIKPTWEKISAAIKFAWENILKPTFTFIWNFIKDVLIPAFKDLWTKVQNAWDGLTNAVSAGWNWVKDKVFNPMKTLITETIPGAFTTGVDAVKRAWDRIQDISKVPVKFVIEKIVNGGIIGGINWVADKVGLGKDWLKPFPLPFASGGIYPGYTPGRDIGFAAVSGGEAIMRPEWTRAMGSEYVDGANAAARGGGVAGVRKFLGMYAGGGIVGALSSGIQAILDPVGTFKKAAGALFDNVPGAGALRDAALGGGRKAVDAAVNWVKDQIKGIFGGLASGSGGPAGAAVGFPPWPSGTPGQTGDYRDSGVHNSIEALVRAAGIPYRINNDYRAGDPLWHGLGRAIDFEGYNQDRLAQFFMSMQGRVLELIHSTNAANYGISRGQINEMGPQLWAEHKNHLHVAMANGGIVPGIYDRGGLLMPGGLAYNATNRPEMVRSADQEAELGRKLDKLIAILSSQRGGNTFNVSSKTELDMVLRRIEFEQGGEL